MVLNVKKRLLKKNKEAGSIETRQEDKIYYESAFLTALNLVSMPDIDMKTFIRQLTKEQVNKSLSYISSRAHMDHKIKYLTYFMKEIQTLSNVESKIEHAKAILFEKFQDAFILRYTNPIGTWNVDKLTNELDQQLERLTNNDMGD